MQLLDSVCWPLRPEHCPPGLLRGGGDASATLGAIALWPCGSSPAEAKQFLQCPKPTAPRILCACLCPLLTSLLTACEYGRLGSAFVPSPPLWLAAAAEGAFRPLFVQTLTRGTRPPHCSAGAVLSGSRLQLTPCILLRPP